MKTISLFLFLTFSFISQAQIGVVTINNEDSYPVGQWFTIRGEDYENTMCYYHDLELIYKKLDNFLVDYGLSVKEGKLDEEGNLLWDLDNANGFYVTLMLTTEDEMGFLTVYTYGEDE